MGGNLEEGGGPMKRALIIRPGHAIGDAVFLTPLPRILSEQGYSVDIACQKHNFELFSMNPYVNLTIPLPRVEDLSAEFKTDFETLTGEYDKVLKTSGHVEMGLLHRTDADWGTIPSGKERQDKAKGVSYQDYIYKEIGLDCTGLLPEFYFSTEEKAQIEAMKELLAKDKRKLVIWAWEGSSQSKTMVFGPAYLKEVLGKHEHSMHYVFAHSPDLQAQIPEHPRAFNAWGASSIRNTIMMASLASLVIGPESFLVNAAAAFDTPKMIFFSHSAPENLAKYYKNCMAVVPIADVTCSPCYLIHCDFRTLWHPEKRAIAREYERNCQVVAKGFPYRMEGYKCCYYLPHDKIVNNILSVLKKKKN
jgi:ADP-heptose:LPS heptosyltransferase